MAYRGKLTQIIIIVGCALVLFCLSSQTSLAAQRWQLVIMPDAQDQTPIELAELHNIIALGLTTALVNADVDVHNPHNLGLPNCISQDCSNLSGQRIRQLVLATGTELNIALLYHFQLQKQQQDSQDQWNLKLSARIIDLETDTEQESFDLSQQLHNQPLSCSGACFRQKLNQQTSILTQELGAVLSEKISVLPRRFHYTLDLQDFTSDELQHIDTYMKTLHGYVADTLVRDYQSQNQWLHHIASREYRYVTSLSGSELSSTLKNLASQLGISLHLVYRHDQQRFMLIRASLPYGLVYLATPALLIIIILLLGRLYTLRHQQQHLHKLANEAKAQQWLDYFNNMPNQWLPRPSRWYLQHQQIIGNINEAKELAAQAWQQIKLNDYHTAKQHLSAALRLNSEDSQALSLQNHLADYQLGFDYLQLAQSCVINDPALALTYLRNALMLNPHLAAQITALKQQCHERLGEIADNNDENTINSEKQSSVDTTFTQQPNVDDTIEHLRAPLPKLLSKGPWIVSTMLLMLLVFIAYGIFAYGQQQSAVAALATDAQMSPLATSLDNNQQDADDKIHSQADENKKRDIAAWHRATSLNTLDSYQAYLSAWPAGQFATYAAQTLKVKLADKTAWQTAVNQDNGEAYQHYLAIQPLGDFAELAQQKLSKIQHQQQQIEQRQVLLAQGDHAYFNQQNYQQARNYYQQAAELGSAQAQYQLGLLYANAKGVKQDYRQAAKWYAQAAEQGVKAAQSHLAYLYSKGKGLNQDYRLAVSWYLKAAQQDDVIAQYNVAYMYAQGQGVTKNYQQAVYWYQKAAAQGDADAQNNLAKLYERGLGVQRDIKQAKSLYQQAAAQGHQIAKINLEMLKN